MALRIRASSEENGTVHIHGNAEGLQYVSGIALAVIGQPPGPNQHVVGPGFNADDDSLTFMICYDQSLEPGGSTRSEEGLRAFTEENGMFHIHGNREGLEYLSEIALAVIGQPPGSNHYVVGPGFCADDDSLMFMICYDQSLEPEDLGKSQEQPPST